MNDDRSYRLEAIGADLWRGRAKPADYDQRLDEARVMLVDEAMSDTRSALVCDLAVAQGRIARLLRAHCQSSLVIGFGPVAILLPRPRFPRLRRSAERAGTAVRRCWRRLSGRPQRLSIEESKP